MIEICALASGSNGNCYYIGNENEAILVDAGISRRQVLERMKERSLNPSKIKGILISHEHADHFKGVRVLSKQLDVPVYITHRSLEKSWGPNRPALIKNFTPGERIEIGDFIIHTFLKQHDAAEPCSFRIEHDGVNVGVMTDIGSPCDNVIQHFSSCQAVFLESNYDEDMLWNGVYPWHLKNRVASEVGHLSNAQAVELLDIHGGADLEVVFLSHLSAENNTPQLALEAFNSLSHRFDVRLTNRYAAAEVFRLEKKPVTV
ncbi:phosphoribosyl 1,2-cyclic phosphodiesterase [Marinilabilia salmonicolor]|jgi:phosphoribosyl 1,2-cyclic phosphodiesterase|uniref:MBL fold metallo-hydrolase n=1 Tax=Marinilabilia salmonicolor TaxID=989 RepID=UPI000D0709EA|nr:MBL fold metallo-hydrolase [Marinilabilia salmonicolor]PRZ00357.1 phosphoribosyl 1,2-cyclic phosphodiesterase [Marinilabilia salmonicolor]